MRAKKWSNNYNEKNESDLFTCATNKAIGLEIKKNPKWLKSNLKDKEEYSIEVKGSKYSVFIDAAYF